jgi:hypothetical protein
LHSLIAKNMGSPEEVLLKAFVKVSFPPRCSLAAAPLLPAAQLSTDARTAIPHDVQQLVVIDYRAMQNSTAAMDLRDRVMPPELKQFDEALRKSGLNDNHDVDSWLSRSSARRLQRGLVTVGIAQGQFPCRTFWPTSSKNKVKPPWSAPTKSIRWPRPAWWFASSTPPPWSSV